MLVGLQRFARAFAKLAATATGVFGRIEIPIDVDVNVTAHSNDAFCLATSSSL
jgi:hypothetical protein